MKMLIIGAKGLLGSYLVELLQGHEVIAWDRDEIDITSQSAVREKIPADHPDVIINCAAYNDVDRAETESEIASAVNGHAVGYLAETAKTIGALMIHYSSAFVFDGKNKNGYTENDEPSPLSAYARSKVLGERLLQEKSNRWYLIRTDRLYGKLPPGHQGKKPFIDLMLELGRAKPYLEVVDDEVGSPTYALDLAKATQDMIESNLPFGIYHRTGSGGCTWYEFAREIFRLKNMSVDLRPVPRSRFPVPAARPKCGLLETTKLPPMRSWQEALSSYLLGSHF